MTYPPPLTKSREAELVALLPDKSARDELIECNIRLVAKVAMRYINQGVEYEDLIQIGAIGLINAVDNFNPALGYAISSYAVPSIESRINRYFRAINAKRRTAHVTSLDRVILTGDDGRDITLSDVVPAPEDIRMTIDGFLMRKAIPALPEREKTVLCMLYGGYVQREVAEHIGVTQAQVSRICTNAINKLRNAVGS